VQHRPAPKHTTPCYSPASFGQSGIGRESLAAAAPQERARARPAMRAVLHIVGRGDAADRPQVRRFPPFPPKPPCFRLQYHQTCKGHPLCRHSPIHFTDIINPSTLPNSIAHTFHRSVPSISNGRPCSAALLFSSPSHSLL
jgi:hypothetical protein